MTFDPTFVEVTCVTLPKDKNLNQRSLTPRWPLTPHLLRSYVWLYPRIIVSKSHEKKSRYVDTVTFFAKTLKRRSLTLRWPLTPHLLRSHVWLYPRIIVSKSHENTSKYVDTVTLFAKTWSKGHWPLDDLWPHICWGFMCDSTQGSLCPSPMKIYQSMWIQWPFLQKNLNQRSLTPRWPLTPHLLRSHVWLYPRIIVSKSHENTSKYVDTVNLFAKTWTKGHWPLDDLWPHICWGHMCDSTQGSLCPSPMGIHQCMWIQWSSLQKLPHTYTYYIHTMYRISDHIVSFLTTFRRDKNCMLIKTNSSKRANGALSLLESKLLSNDNSFFKSRKLLQLHAYPKVMNLVDINQNYKSIICQRSVDFIVKDEIVPPFGRIPPF